MSAKHVSGGQLKMNVLDVRETPFGRTSTNQRQEKKNVQCKNECFRCPQNTPRADIYKPASVKKTYVQSKNEYIRCPQTPLGRTSTKQRHEKNQQ